MQIEKPRLILLLISYGVVHIGCSETLLHNCQILESSSILTHLDGVSDVIFCSFINGSLSALSTIAICLKEQKCSNFYPHDFSCSSSSVISYNCCVSSSFSLQISFFSLCRYFFASCTES